MVKNYQLCIVREQNMQQNDSESRRNYFCQHQKIVPSPQPTPISRFSAAPKSWSTTSCLVYQFDNHTTKFDTKIGKKVPISW